MPPPSSWRRLGRKLGHAAAGTFRSRGEFAILRAFLAVSAAFLPLVALADPLPSWSDTDARAAIIAFVESVTDPGADTFVREDNRIAVFDNNGALWSEQPAYFQLLFAHDVLREKAATNPSILTSAVRRAAAAGRHGGDDGPRRAGARRNHQRFAFRHHGR